MVRISSNNTTCNYEFHTRCLVCGEILRGTRNEVLIAHLRRKHPFMNVGQHIAPKSRRRPEPHPPVRPTCPKPCPPVCVPPCPPYNACGPYPPQPCPPACVPPCPPYKACGRCPPPPCPPACVPPCPPYKACGPCPPQPCPPCPPYNACGPCPPQPCPPPPSCPPVPCPVPCAVNCPGPTQKDYCRALEKQQRREIQTKYKCTVESWKPGCTKVVCPCCRCEAQPVIRRQRNQLANSSLGACFMLGCWPLATLPFLLCESPVVNLYCAQCNNFLGAYNRKQGCVIDVQANLCNPGYTPNFPSIK